MSRSKHRFRDRAAKMAERSVLGGQVEPPFCPFIGGCLGQQINRKVIAAGGEMVEMQFSFVPIPCLRTTCMMWDPDSEPPQCGLVSIMDELLGEDEEDGEDGALQD